MVIELDDAIVFRRDAGFDILGGEGISERVGRHGSPALFAFSDKRVTRHHIECRKTTDFRLKLHIGSPQWHLRTHYDLTPERYREKWGLPADYPMVAPNYAVARSKLARQMGLGQRSRRK